MSYQSRRNCELKHITGCGLCPQMFDCPYDKNENKSEKKQNKKGDNDEQKRADRLNQKLVEIL